MLFKKVFVAITLAVCLTGLSFSAGCSGPGEVVKGTASNEDLKKPSGDTDEHGREAPDGVGIMN